MSLFGLVNFIAEKMITEPKKIDAMFDGLPAGARAVIDKRDNKQTVKWLFLETLQAAI